MSSRLSSRCRSIRQVEVVLAREGLGLTTQIFRFAERLAEEGFTVVAPDFFFRTG